MLKDFNIKHFKKKNWNQPFSKKNFDKFSKKKRDKNVRKTNFFYKKKKLK